MRAVGTVVDFSEHASTRAAEQAAARQRHPAGTYTPFTAVVAGVARFIADHRLPEGDIAILRTLGVVVDLTGRSHVAGAVTCWANLLGTKVTTKPEVADGKLWTYYEARGYLPDLTFIRVVARALTVTS